LPDESADLVLVEVLELVIFSHRSALRIQSGDLSVDFAKGQETRTLKLSPSLNSLTRTAPNFMDLDAIHAPDVEGILRSVCNARHDPLLALPRCAYVDDSVASETVVD